MDSVIVFTSALSPVKSHIQLIKKKDNSYDVKEIDHQLRILVKDTARMLQTVTEPDSAAQRPSDHKVMGSVSK